MSKVVCLRCRDDVGCVVSLCRGCVGSCAFCLSCDACSCRCVLIGRTFVSSCKCCVFVSAVQPVAVRSAVFCIVCSVLMFVFDAMGDQTVLPNSRIGRVIVLYVVMIVSFCFPQCVDVSVLSMLVVFCAFSFVVCMCLLYVSFGSKVSPSIFG